MPIKPQSEIINEETAEWDLVAEARTKVIFDTDGDVFEGTYEGPEQIPDPNTGEIYEYLNFRKGDDGYTTSANYQLARAFSNVTPGTYVRITRLGQSSVAKGFMTNFKVQARRS